MPEFAELSEVFQANVRPTMLADLAETLGVSSGSLARLGIGWYPLEACWVFAERDAEGNVVGLIRRFKNGKKLSLKGGQRGLTYPLAEGFTGGKDGYTPGSQNWTHTNEDYPCPICGKADWCLVSSENPADPKAVICGRKAEGASSPLGDAGYLHIRRSEGIVSRGGSPLQPSTLPVLIVEGQSDVAAAYDLGFIAVGKPSASGGGQALGDLLVGRDVIVIGENDAGVGRLGMEKTFEALRPKVKSIVKVMPPPLIKDLRQWMKAGLTQADLLKAAAEGDTESEDNILQRTAPLYLAELWLKKENSAEGVPLIRKYQGAWYRYSGQRYAEIDEETELRGPLYRFLQDRKCIKQTAKGPEIGVYDPTRARVSDILDAMNMSCPVKHEPPCWLGDPGDMPPAQSIVPFANGLLDVEAYTKGETRLLPASPLFFCQAILPYAFDPKADCPVWLKFLSEIFPDDRLSIFLLQEWFGYNTVSDNSHEKLMMFVGRPSAGKGTVLTALEAVLGHDQVASSSFDGLADTFGLHDLIDKLAVILPDAHITKRGDPMKSLEILKAITGGDSLGINRKYLGKVKVKLPCRVTISVNDLPELPDHARTLERRLLLLYFGQSFEGREDITLKKRVAAEAPGIAAWALTGLQRLRAQGRFTSPPNSAPVVKDFRRVISSITEFVEDICELGTDTTLYFVQRQMLFDAWVAWSKANDTNWGSRAKFGVRLSALYPGLHSVRRAYGSSLENTYEGIRLTEEGMRRYVMKEPI